MDDRCAAVEICPRQTDGYEKHVCFIGSITHGVRRAERYGAVINEIAGAILDWSGIKRFLKRCRKVRQLVPGAQPDRLDLFDQDLRRPNVFKRHVRDLESGKKSGIKRNDGNSQKCRRNEHLRKSVTGPRPRMELRWSAESHRGKRIG